MAKGMRSTSIHRDTSGGWLETKAAVPPDDEAAARQTLATYAELAANPNAISFKHLGTDKVPLSPNRIVKFRQLLNAVPVYGSLVAVELDAERKAVSIDATFFETADVDTQPAISSDRAIAVAGEWAGSAVKAEPKLYLYYDDKSRWRLVYILESVQRTKADGNGAYSDVVIDAHGGEHVADLPRGVRLVEDREVEALDDLKQRRAVKVIRDTATDEMQLVDRERNIRTHDFGFQDYRIMNFNPLPGPVCEAIEGKWSPAAICCHANTRIVADFLLEVLERNSLDNEGCEIVSSVNVSESEKEWRNARWVPSQAIYGQRKVGDKLRSYASALDIVAHEIMHGVTENSARIEYRLQRGALNESYSDILGVIVGNFAEPDIGKWEWRIGEEMRTDGTSIRNLADPAACGHPAHMDDFVEMPEDKDFGGVHINSAIHNHAAFRIMTSRDEAGGLLLTPLEAVHLFYVTLVSRLSRTSEFADSRRGLVQTARSQFSGDKRSRIVTAIEGAFDAVGVPADG